MTATLPSTRDAQGLPSAALLDDLQPDLRLAASELLDWLLRTTPALTEPVDVVEAVCERLIGLGVPVDRYRTSTTVNTADADAYGRTWIRGQGVSETSYVSPGGDDPDFLHSPFHVASTTGRWADLWPSETADDRFGIVPELKAAGYTRYIYAPLRTLAGIQGWTTVATTAPQGFRCTWRDQDRCASGRDGANQWLSCPDPAAVN